MLCGYDVDFLEWKIYVGLVFMFEGGASSIYGQRSGIRNIKYNIRSPEVGVPRQEHFPYNNKKAL